MNEIYRYACRFEAAIAFLEGVELWKLSKAESKCNDMREISIACLSPFLMGKPDTTMYASPIVSTSKSKVINSFIFEDKIWFHSF